MHIIQDVSAVTLNKVWHGRRGKMVKKVEFVMTNGSVKVQVNECVLPVVGEHIQTLLPDTAKTNRKSR